MLAAADIPPDTIRPSAAAVRPGDTPDGPIIGLDALRFGAAALVMAYHLACTAWLVPSSEAAGLIPEPIAFPELLPLSSIGWVGVPVFFVVSGYVIATSAWHSTPARFLLNRFLRLMPGIWFCATLSFGVAAILAPEPLAILVERYLRTLVLFPAPRWIDGVYWTLGIEIVFYGLVYALLRLDRLRWLERTVVAVGIVSTLLWCVAASGFLPGLDTLISTRIAKLALITHGCDFAIGLLLWAGARGGWTPTRQAGLALCLVGALLQIRYDAQAVDMALGRQTPLAVPFGAFVGMLVLGFISVAGNARVLARFPELAPRLRQIGLLTYPLYLLHTFVGVPAMRVAAALGLPPILCLAAGYVTALLAALLVARSIEPPLRQALRKVIERLPSLPAAVSAPAWTAATLSRRRVASLAAPPHSPA